MSVGKVCELQKLKGAKILFHTNFWLVNISTYCFPKSEKNAPNLKFQEYLRNIYYFFKLGFTVICLLLCMIVLVWSAWMRSKIFRILKTLPFKIKNQENLKTGKFYGLRFVICSNCAYGDCIVIYYVFFYSI